MNSYMYICHKPIVIRLTAKPMLKWPARTRSIRSPTFLSDFQNYFILNFHLLNPKMVSTNKYWVFVLVHLVLSISTAYSDDIQSLLKFKNSLTNNTALNDWGGSNNPCTGDNPNWKGLKCSNNSILGLRLENMGLSGELNIDALAEILSIRTVSLMNNSIGGTLPDVKKLGGAFRSLYLSNNKFEGEIKDDAFAGMSSLKKLYLSHNNFSGKAPSSLAGLTQLLDLRLDNNGFQGRIPDLSSNELVYLDLSNNKFNGSIPGSLSKFNLTSFSGNAGLCGMPLIPCKRGKKSIPKVAIIGIVIGAVALIVLILGAFIINRSQSKKPASKKSSLVKSSSNKIRNDGSSDQQEPHKKGETGKLCFVREDRERFELQDLLRASAEVLGSGSFGSSYKASLLTGSAMVVKRFRQMSNIGKNDFHEHMSRIGRLSHPNLLPLVAFYYKKEEKLLVSDFVENGSLASHLHGKRTPEKRSLDWPTRLKIIKGVAKGLTYLYQELPNLTLPHGHLKSSNVLLDKSFEPILGDYALVPVINKEHAQQLMIAYKSPEYTEHDKTTRKTDVWSFGILILEMLTGRFPANYLKQGKGGKPDLAAWVNSVVREEWTGEVFDKEMKGTRNGEGEMLKLLRIGMCCCEWNVERRWDLREAVEKIEELKERDNDEDNSSYTSDGEIYSSRAMTDDEFSFSVTK